MKNFKKILIVIATAVAFAIPAQAQFQWGVKAGVNINKLSLSKEVVNEVTNPESHAGYTAGLTTKFTLPLIGLGFDASLMYTHRVYSIEEGTQSRSPKSDLIELPIHLRYDLSLPIVGKIITPYIFTGPSFGFALDKNILSNVESKSCEVIWDLGIGVLLVNHLQISANYGWGVNDYMKYVPINTGINTKSLGKNNCWTISAAYLF